MDRRSWSSGCEFKGFRASMNVIFEEGIPGFMDGIQDFMDKFKTFD